VGLSAADLSGFSLEGVPRTVDLPTPLPVVVYFFSPSCAWCERNWANVEALSRAASHRYRVVAVSTERSLKAYVTERRLTVDVLEGLDERVRRSFGFTLTPHTIVVSPEGLITHDWRGAFTPRVERQVEELFDILLPGVAPAVARR
jgi:peroxiredoxin